MFELGLHSDLCCTEKEVYRTEGEGAHSWDGPVKPPTPACLLENLGGLGLSIIILSWRGVRDTTSPQPGWLSENSQLLSAHRRLSCDFQWLISYPRM